MSDGDLTELATAAVGLHELFTAFLEAGFDPSQAIYLTGVAMKGADA